MELHLPADIALQITTALSKAGHREIGGILMGEHIAEGTFAIREVTIQRMGGTFAAFLRTVQDMIHSLGAFFRATNNDYRRFNYLGEWHSHPSFAPVPSGTDHQTMRDIIDDPEVGALFVLLMVVKLDQSQQLSGSVTVYQPRGGQSEGKLIVEKPLL